MEEMNMINEMELDNNDFDEESTDLVVVDDSNDSEGGIGVGEIALGGLALIGAGFLVKKTYDIGKKGVVKVIDWIKSKKNNKAEPQQVEEVEDADEEVVDVEPDEIEDIPEEETPKETSGKKRKK